MVILRAIIHEEEDAHGRQAVDEALEERLGLGIDPVQVFADQQHGLDLTLTQQKALEGVEGPLTPLGRIGSCTRYQLALQSRRRTAASTWNVVGNRFTFRRPNLANAPRPGRR